MQARSIIGLVVSGVILAGIIFFGAYNLGARDTGAIRSEYAAAVADYDIRLAELRRSMGESEERIDSIGRGLGEAVELASKSTDRSKRIALLIAGIESALEIIRPEP